MKTPRALLIALTGMIVATLVGTMNPLVPAGAATPSPVSESFGGPAFPPTGWVADSPWTSNSACAELDGSTCATVAPAASSGPRQLKLPAFSTNHLTDPKLQFDLYVSDPSLSASFMVQKGWQGGWDGINYPHMNSLGGVKQSVSVDLVANTDYLLALAFSQTGSGGFAKVDNVTVTGGAGTNLAPVATAVTTSVNEDGAVPITLLGHDTDGDDVTFAIASNPAHGTVSGNAPNVTYQPAKDWNGTDTFTFVTNDGDSNSAPATVTVNVVDINDVPVVSGPTAVTTSPGTPVHFQSAFSNALAFVDPDVGSAPLSVYLVSTGTMNLGRTTGLTFTTGDGTADTAMNFTGTLTAVNAALDGLWVAVPAGQTSFNLTIGGNDGAQAVERTIPITISSVAAYQVDALVASQGTDISGATGDGVRVAPTTAVSDNQRVTLPTADPWSFQKASLWVQNDGTALDRFKLTATSGDSDVEVGYLINGVDIASSLKNGTAATGSLSPGQATRIEVQFRVAQNPKNTATRTYRVTATSDHDTTATDSVEFVLPLLGVAQADLSVKSNQVEDPFAGAAGNLPQGATVINTSDDPTITNAVQIGGSASTFDVVLDNPGNANGRVMVRSQMSMIGFDYKLFLVDANGVRTDVTTVAGSGVGLPVELASKAKKHFTAEVFWVPSTSFQSNRADLVITAGALGNDQTDKVVIRTVQIKPAVDLAIAGPGQTTAGGVGAFNPADSTQLRSANVAAGEGASFRVDARNATSPSVPNWSDRIAWTSTGVPAGWTVSYFAGDSQTSLDSSFATNSYGAPVAPKGFGGSDPVSTVRVVVTPGPTVRPGDVATVNITGRSTRSNATIPPSDTVTMTVKMAYQVDALVGPPGGPFLGGGIVNTTAAGQIASQTVKIGVDGVRTVRIKNTGAIGDRYKLTVPAADITGPGGVVTLMSGGSKLTNAVQTPEGAIFDLAAGSSADVDVTVRPDGQFGPGSARDVTLTVASVNHTGVKPDVVKISTVVGQLDCSPQTIAFDNIKLSGSCILSTGDTYVSTQPIDLNGLHFTFPAGAAGVVYKTQPWVIPKYATQYIPWFRSSHTAMSFNGATLLDGPLDIRLGGGGSSTIRSVGASGSINGLALDPNGQLNLAFPGDKPGRSVLEVPLFPPPLFAQRGSAPQPITTDSAGPAQIPLTMSFPQLIYGTIGMVDIKATWDPATDTWTGFGRMGFPGGLVFPTITTVMKFTGSSGGYKMTYFFGRLNFGSVEVLVAPEVFLTGLEAMYDGSAGVLYGKAKFEALPITHLIKASPGSKLASIPGNVFGIDGKFAYLDGPQTLSVGGSITLLGLLNLGDATFTAGPAGMRATANWNYTVNLGPLGVAGITARVDGGASSTGFQIDGTGNIIIGGSNVGSMSLILSSKGAAGCGSVFGAAAGFGFDWGGNPTIITGRCDLSPWQDANIPAHADFAGIQSQITTLLGKVDDVQKLMNALPGAVQQQLGL